MGQNTGLLQNRININICHTTAPKNHQKVKTHPILLLVHQQEIQIWGDKKPTQCSFEKIQHTENHSKYSPLRARQQPYNTPPLPSTIIIPTFPNLAPKPSTPSPIVHTPAPPTPTPRSRIRLADPPIPLRGLPRVLALLRTHAARPRAAPAPHRTLERATRALWDPNAKKARSSPKGTLSFSSTRWGPAPLVYIDDVARCPSVGYPLHTWIADVGAG